MPNQRAPGQVLMPIPVDSKFLRELDAVALLAEHRTNHLYFPLALVGRVILQDGRIVDDGVRIPPTERLDRLTACIRRLAVENGHIRASLRQSHRHRCAEALRRPRHERDFSGQLE